MIFMQHVTFQKKEFRAGCGICNYPLKEQTKTESSSKLLFCCIGMKPISVNDVYYICGSAECSCAYIVCSQCHKYGILRYLIDRTKTNKWSSLDRKAKWTTEQHIKVYMRKFQKAANNKKKFSERRKLMTKVLTTPEYWYGRKVLMDKEWHKIYWMDVTIQLRWLLAIRHRIVSQVKQCLMKQTVLNEHIVNEIMKMLCNTTKVNGCFIK